MINNKKVSVIYPIVIISIVIVSILLSILCIFNSNYAYAAGEIEQNYLYDSMITADTSNNTSDQNVHFYESDNCLYVEVKRYVTTNVWSYFTISTIYSEDTVISFGVYNYDFVEGGSQPLYILCPDNDWKSYGTTDTNGDILIAVRVGGQDLSTSYIDLYANVGAYLGPTACEVYLPPSVTQTMLDSVYTEYASGQYSDGYTDGLNDNSEAEDNYYQGYSDGLLSADNGYDLGYEEGYNYGVAKANDIAYNDVTGVSAVAALLSGVQECLEVDIFGTFSIADLMTVVVSILLFFVFLKLFKEG
jgi:hypothetical protein